MAGGGKRASGERRRPATTWVEKGFRIESRVWRWRPPWLWEELLAGQEIGVWGREDSGWAEGLIDHGL